MKQEQLNRGNELRELIKQHKEALLCFEFEDGETRNPQVTIVYDDYDPDLYRATQPIPMVLSDFFIKITKEQIKENLEKLEKEFDEL